MDFIIKNIKDVKYAVNAKQEVYDKIISKLETMGEEEVLLIAVDKDIKVNAHRTKIQNALSDRLKGTNKRVKISLVDGGKFFALCLMDKKI